MSRGARLARAIRRNQNRGCNRWWFRKYAHKMYDWMALAC